MQHCAGELGTNIFTPFGGIGVAVFLLLSGFGLTESFSKRGMRGFLKSKLWRVWVPFLLFYTGIYLLYDKHNYKNLFLNICSIRQDDYWYVHYMLRCYLVFWVAFKFFYKYRWYLLVAFAIYTFFCMDAIRAEQCLSFPIGVLLSEKRKKFLLLSKRKYVQLMAIFCIIGLVSLAIKQLPEVRDLCGTPFYSLVEFGIKLPLGISVMIILWL
ncbi:acyltransferase family protein, partial [Bacteroides ovatus]|uniref:acyltransferase family protein n=2 Tax=Bacteroides TaxID=816 RepID=UPI001E4C5287